MNALIGSGRNLQPCVSTFRHASDIAKCLPEYEAFLHSCPPSEKACAELADQFIRSGLQ